MNVEYQNELDLIENYIYYINKPNDMLIQSVIPKYVTFMGGPLNLR